MRNLLVSLLVLMPLAATPVLADTADDPILTIDGATADGKAHIFKRSDLEAMAKASFSTTTPWNTGAVKFDGVPMNILMKAVGEHGTSAHVVATNNYAVDIPTSDFQQTGAIMAYKRDGDFMPVRDQGPFFIVYPYDSDAKYKTELYYSRSAWQVMSITLQ